MRPLHSIKLGLSEKLRDVNYRQRFFQNLARDEVATQIRDLRARRKLRQMDFAKRARMQQSAVSRIENAEYSSWNFKTLLRVASALDARLRILFEPAEDAIREFEALEDGDPRDQRPARALEAFYNASLAGPNQRLEIKSELPVLKLPMQDMSSVSSVFGPASPMGLGGKIAA